jgi:hypothetical protein
MRRGRDRNQAEENHVGVLQGLVAPAGEGKVIEVHLDMMEASIAFLSRLNDLGFENDPFIDFYPPEYHFHYTGRTRALERDVRKILPTIEALVAETIEEARKADVKLYAEIELVRSIHHFDGGGSDSDLSGLDSIQFRKSGEAFLTKADVHVEFRSGTVPGQVRALLESRGFYWVRTPASQLFPSEEIATLQASVFNDALHVYDRLVAAPLPACTGIHLEQKLAMIPSNPDLPMPGAMEMIPAASSKVQ